jgi:hypothetical protein
VVEPFAGHQKVVIMGKFLSYLILLIALVSCRATRNMESQSDKSNVDSVAASSARIEREQRAIDTTRTETGKVTITEITFFAPDTATDTPPMADVRLPTFGNVKGAIKGIKQTIIEKGVEQSGKSNESKESEETQENAELSKQQNHIQKQEATKTSSFNWRWACIAVIALALVLYWKRMPILDWIRKILAGIRKIL